MERNPYLESQNQVFNRLLCARNWAHACPQICGALAFSVPDIEAANYEAPDIGAEG
jgi:hypothetical protein